MPLTATSSTTSAERRRYRLSHDGLPGGAPRLQPDTLPHFEAFCRKFLVLDNHKPFELEDFQRRILRDFFNGCTETLVLLPKKNGKTTLLAALALYHLIYTADAACYIAASSRDQATIMYDQARGFLERKDRRTGELLPQSAALQRRLALRRGSREIRSRRDSGFIRVLAGDRDTADGVIPTLALVDELHRHKDNGELYGVLADGLGPRDGRILTISTAGERLKSALGRIRNRAMRMKQVARRGAYTYARSSTGGFVMHEWALRPDENREDIRVVKRANPLSTNTTAKLKIRKSSPTMTPSRWARFACGVWMQGEDAAISTLDLQRATRKRLKLTLGDIWLGLDVGWRWDTTAIVPYQPTSRTAGRFGVSKIIKPPGDGTSLRRATIIESILWYREQGFTIRGVVFDRNAEGEAIAQELEDEHDIETVDWPQKAGAMAEASMGLTIAIAERRALFPAEDEEMRDHLLACRAKTTSGEEWRFVAPTQNRGRRKQGEQDGDDVEHIDGAIAASMVRASVHAEMNAEDETLDLEDLTIGVV